MTVRDVFRLLLLIPWVIFLIYWIIGAFRTRPTREEESLASRYLVVLVETAAYLLVFNHSTEIGFLGKRFIPRTLSGAVLGVLLTWLGIGLALWARYHLAEYWSARVTIKEDHQLIRTGPYAHLRHPIYSGLVLATIGTALVIGKWRCVLGFLLALIGYCIKARKEEAMLTRQFGDAFREHQKHAGFLLPRFR
ncbi:MAG: isoprenylcysteine carboxylmethyltransferase family protein [Terriglobales bacterium]